MSLALSLAVGSVYLIRAGCGPTLVRMLMSNVLVVDDDPDSRDVLCRFLAQKGHQCDFAPNGRVALTSILDHLPDVVVLDLFMPEMDGARLLDVLRSYLRLKSLPVVVWTAMSDVHPLVTKAQRIGVDVILFKPTASFQRIAEEVEHAVARRVH